MGSNNYAPVYNIAPGIMYDVKKDCLPNILQDISKSNSRNASQSIENYQGEELVNMNIKGSKNNSNASSMKELDPEMQASFIEDEMQTKEAAQEFKTLRFYQLFFMISSLLGIPLCLMNYFTSYCMTFYSASQAANFAVIASCSTMLFKFIFGWILDKFGMEVFLYIHIVMNILAVLGQYHLYMYRWIFLLSYGCLYGLFGSACTFYYVGPTFIYGDKLGLKIFSVLGYANSSVIVLIFVFDTLQFHYGWQVSYWLLIILLVILQYLSNKLR